MISGSMCPWIQSSIQNTTQNHNCNASSSGYIRQRMKGSSRIVQSAQEIRHRIQTTRLLYMRGLRDAAVPAL
jgi:hypothetical protein